MTAKKKKYDTKLISYIIYCMQEPTFQKMFVIFKANFSDILVVLLEIWCGDFSYNYGPYLLALSRCICVCAIYCECKKLETRKLVKIHICQVANLAKSVYIQTLKWCSNCFSHSWQWPSFSRLHFWHFIWFPLNIWKMVKDKASHYDCHQIWICYYVLSIAILTFDRSAF